MADVPEGRQRTPYLVSLAHDVLKMPYVSLQAIGCEDQTVRIVSLAPDTCMDTISIQALTAVPSSICVAEILDGSIDKFRPTLFVNIGLVNGVLLRTVLDSTTGQLTDTRTR
jgi:splicing factor 3B subunit 3